MKKAIVVEHISIELESNFDNFTFHLEKALGILTPSTLQALGASPASMVSYLNSTSDETNLMLFNILVQDDLTKKENRRKIKQYHVGNPTIMLRMIENHPGAGLYIPIHLLVYEKFNGKAVVEYDRLLLRLRSFIIPKFFLIQSLWKTCSLNLFELLMKEIMTWFPNKSINKM